MLRRARRSASAYPALASLLFACAPTDRPLPAIELLGSRLVIGRDPAERLWVFDATRAPRLWVDGAWAAGLSLVLRAPSGDQALDFVVEVRGETTLVTTSTLPATPGARLCVMDGARVHRAWPVEVHEPPEAWTPLATAAAARARGDYAGARAALDAVTHPTSAQAYWLQVERARIAHNGGDLDAGVRAWTRAADQARELGWVEEVGRALRAAAFLAWTQLDLDTQDRLLTEAERADIEAGARLGPVRSRYHRGLRALEIQDARAAEEALASAASNAWALGEDADWANATTALADALQRSGRHAEALEVLARVEPYYRARQVDRREYARFRLTQAWILTRAMAQGAAPVDFARPRAIWQEVLESTANGRDPLRRANCLSNLAWIAVLSGDLDEADVQLRAARQADPALTGEHGVFVRLMEAELALARRQPRRALELLGAMQRAADPSDLELAWQLSFGVGRSARALGQDAVAERHLSAALDTLEELARRTALTTTRAYFVADRRAVPQTLAAWRRSRGDVAGAFEVAERSRTAVIRALASVSQLERLAAPERAAWERLAAQYFGERERLERTQSAGELLGAEARVAWQAERGQRRAALAETFERLVAMVDTASTPALPRVTAAEVSAALAPGQALLLLEPTRTGTAAYWLTRDELVYVERPSGPPWTAIEARLASIDHLFVVGAARPSALSTWSPGGGPPLGERVGISHLPHAGTLLAPRRSATADAVVIADPTSDLPAARREGSRVQALVPGARLLVGGEASRRAALDGLRGARLFHYAGHASAPADRPWDVHLELAEHQRLTLTDLLLAAPAAGVVVLSGCGTGVAPAPAAPLGLADALVIGGSRVVLATDRAVPDRAALSFVEAFYAAGGADDPPRALREVTRRARADGDELWPAFYLVGRP
jgi:hypothetical protein